MTDRVSVSIDNHVAEVTLTRADKMNALDMEMFEAISAAGEALRGNRDVRAVVLTGEGPDFCAGIDVSAFTALGGDPAATAKKLFSLPEGEVANFFQKPCIVWQQVGVPVIAALNGHTLGGGFQIALGADMRFAAPDVKMSVMEIKWGLIPDMGITRTLPRLVRADVAKELSMTGRVFGAEEAAALGLVTRVTADPLTAAREAAAAIAGKSPDAIRRIKALYDRTWTEGDARTTLQAEAKLQSEILGRPNQTEAVMANMQKRAPKFS